MNGRSDDLTHVHFVITQNKTKNKVDIKYFFKIVNICYLKFINFTSINFFTLIILLRVIFVLHHMYPSYHRR